MLKENYVSRLELKYIIEYNGLVLMSREKKPDMLSKTKTYYRKPKNESCQIESREREIKRQTRR